MRTHFWRNLAGTGALMALLAVVRCGQSGLLGPSPADVSRNGGSSAESPLPIRRISGTDIVFAGAGDIALCGTSGAERTGRLLDRLPGFVFTLGDNVYPSSTADRLLQCYEPAWGRHLARSFASPGNHDWEVESGKPYFDYFGAAAGPPGVGYYSFDLGTWQVLSLNSNIPADPGSPQYEWVKRNVAASGGGCSLAMWHHPVFTSGSYGSNPHMKQVWRLLDGAGLDVVITGHEHSYERFAAQDADGRPDDQGIREFVVGTGGAELRPFGTIQPNSESRRSDVYGVLKFVLRASGYEWEFLAADSASVLESGSASCVK